MLINEPQNSQQLGVSERTVIVDAASRLHFGLLAPCGWSARRFGGVGAMVQPPSLRVRVQSARDKAAAFSASGPLASAAEQAIQRVRAAGWLAVAEPPVVEVLSAPRAHTGLGTGTQLALSIVAGLRAYASLPALSPQELAKQSGRGVRSAVGVHGFFSGGLVVEAGKRDRDTLAPLVARMALPDAWRFVLMTVEGEQGLWGAAERAAFQQLSEAPAGVVERLCRLVLLGILPAAAEEDFAAFSERLYEFGRDAGSLFASVQGGQFATPGVASRVERVRRHGIRGVGQSSWGPTVFALAESDEHANWLVARLAEDGTTAGCQVVVARPVNEGARILVSHSSAG